MSWRPKWYDAIPALAERARAALGPERPTAT
jgi:hypothetical protein